mgnify:CR=1 FL=1
MATRSTIAVLNTNGRVSQIYCHWDGYPEQNGKILVNHYSDPNKINLLMALGNLSSLGSEIGEPQDFNNPTDKNWCVAYGRDRGKSETESIKYDDINDFLENGEEFNYVWDGARWNCFGGQDIDCMIDLYNIKQTA